MYINLAWKYGLIAEKERRNVYVKDTLDVTCECTKIETDFVVFEIMLRQAWEDGLIDEMNRNKFRCRASKKNVENDLIKPLRELFCEEVQLLSNSLSAVEKKVDCLGDVVRELNDSFEQRNQYQKLSLCFKGILNIITFGVGGGFVDGVEGAFGLFPFLEKVGDFTEYDAISKEFKQNEEFKAVDLYLSERFQDKQALDTQNIFKGIADDYFNAIAGDNFNGEENIQRDQWGIVVIAAIAKINQKQPPLQTRIETLAAAIGHTFPIGVSGAKNKLDDLETKIIGETQNSTIRPKLREQIEAPENTLEELQEGITNLVRQMFDEATAEHYFKTNLKTKLEALEVNIFEAPNEDGALF